VPFVAEDGHDGACPSNGRAPTRKVVEWRTGRNGSGATFPGRCIETHRQGTPGATTGGHPSNAGGARASQAVQVRVRAAHDTPTAKNAHFFAFFASSRAPFLRLPKKPGANLQLLDEKA